MALSLLKKAILRQAPYLLESDKSSYICNAIRDADVPGFSTIKINDAKGDLRQYVLRSIPGADTLDSWLCQQHGHVWLRKEVVRQTRIAWLKWMLGEDHVMTEVIAKQLRVYARNKSA